MPVCTPSNSQAHEAELEAALRSYRVEVPSDVLDEAGEMIDWLITYTFDTLGARHLELRVKPDAALPDEVCASA
jgi:hypothetical protein